MKGLLLAVGVVCLVAVEARAQCNTACATVAPQHPIILVHGRNDAATRWDTLVTAWKARGYTEGVNLFRIDMATHCGANLNCRTPNYTVDPNASACFLSKVQHLVVPTNTSAIQFAYCEVNKD